MLCNQSESSFNNHSVNPKLINSLTFALYRRNEGLAVITQDSMTIDDIEVLLKDTEHNGYPVVVSRENQYLVGFVLRKDLNLALGKFRSLVMSMMKMMRLIL